MTIRTRWLVWVGAAVLLAFHFCLAVGSKAHESTTADEIVHMVGGVTYWDLNDYRFQPENGNLPQRWAAIPAVIMGTKLPPIDHSFFWKESDVWGFGHQLFYETGDDHFVRLMAGRAMIALFSVATGLLIFVWSRKLFGTPGAFLSLTFFVFFPSFLANGALTTSDACMAFFMLASVGLWWKHLHDRRIWLLILSAVVFGLACVSKFSAALILPMMGILALLRLSNPEPLVLFGKSPTTLGGKGAVIVLSLLVHGAVAVFTIWAFFGFRYSGFNPALPPADSYLQSFSEIRGMIGWQGKVMGVLAAWHALPEAYLYGYTFVVEMSHQRAAFLDYDYSIFGWRSFFVWAFFYKTTLPFLIACVLTATLALTRWKKGATGLWKKDIYVVSPLLVLFAVYWAVSIPSHLNIGERHILPTYPVLLIGLGALGGILAGKRSLAMVTIALLAAWHAGEAIAVYPHYLAYFNETVGGPSQGWKHLADSSLDWGQDLPGLKSWLSANQKGGEQVYLSYFGSGDPAYYGIEAEHLPFVNGYKVPDPFQKLGPGIYCVGATMLDQVYSQVRGNWTIELEADYERLRNLEPLLLQQPKTDAERDKLEKEIPKEVRDHARKRYIDLRFARLCYYLRAKQPDAEVGYSILIYRLNARELHDATAGTLREWANLISGTAAP